MVLVAGEIRLRTPLFVNVTAGIVPHAAVDASTNEPPPMLMRPEFVLAAPDKVRMPAPVFPMVPPPVVMFPAMAEFPDPLKLAAKTPVKLANVNSVLAPA
jgi:hypothetical protein